MKRIFIILFTVVLAIAMMFPSAAAGAITLTLQPQNGTFPENATAYWSVEATGENLKYDWFIRYKGVDYNTSKSFAEQHPWQDGVTGDGYGRNETGNGFFINGVGKTLDGAEIYCVVSNASGSVTSQAAIITVGGKKSPPDLTVPASASADKGAALQLTCKATAANGDKVKSYLWYETATGKLKDIVAIGVREGQPANGPSLTCDTSTPGTRYYVCYVETALGGRSYSSIIPVTVTEKAPETPPAPEKPIDENPSGEVSPPAPKPDETPGTPDTTPDTSGTVDGTQNGETDNKNAVSWTVVWIAAAAAAVVSGGAVAVLFICRKKKP